MLIRMNGMPNPYMPNGAMPQIPNSLIPQPPSINQLLELEDRIKRLERQVKRLESKVFKNEEHGQNDYTASPPKDSGMYMM